MIKSKNILIILIILLLQSCISIKKEHRNTEKDFYKKFEFNYGIYRIQRHYYKLVYLDTNNNIVSKHRGNTCMCKCSPNPGTYTWKYYDNNNLIKKRKRTVSKNRNIKRIKTKIFYDNNKRIIKEKELNIYKDTIVYVKRKKYNSIGKLISNEIFIDTLSKSSLPKSFKQIFINGNK